MSSKSVEPQKEFNPALGRYEPVLPLRKGKKGDDKIGVDWKWIVAILIAAIVFTILIIRS